MKTGNRGSGWRGWRREKKGGWREEWKVLKRERQEVLGKTGNKVCALGGEGGKGGGKEGGNRGRKFVVTLSRDEGTRKIFYCFGRWKLFLLGV